MRTASFQRVRFTGGCWVELRDYLRILRAHWLGVLLFLLAGLAIAFGWTLLQPKMYTASASGYLIATGVDTSSGAGSALAADDLVKSKVKSYVEVGTLRSVADTVIGELKLETTSERLVQQVSITNPADTVVLKVSAISTDPVQSRDIAEAWIRGMSAEIDRLETSGGSVASTTLAAAESAQLPNSPSSPNVQLAVALGGLTGLLLGFGYAITRYVLDRRIRSAEAVERDTGLTVVGAIPDEKSFADGNRLLPFDGGSSPTSKNFHLYAVSESMRELRTNIQYMSVDDPPRSIVVTSSLPGEGKSTTAANLAITLASSGENVVLIDGDLRRPMVATVFGLIGDVGLSDVLAGRASEEDVIQTVGPEGKLRVLASGRIPPNPSELLGSQRMRDLLARLSADAIVIIDAPPLIPVTDASVLTHRADGAVIVAAVGRTTIDALTKAQQNLERADGKALGVVLNRVPRKGAGAAYYGFQYTGAYYRDEQASPSTSRPNADAPPEIDEDSETRASRRRSMRGV